VADLACGTGWAAIELARAFPHVTVDGQDSDEASIAAGRRNAVDHGVADRVTVEVVDLADPAAGWSPRYDLAMFFECVHGFPRPVEVLGHARAALRPGGAVLVVEERAAEEFTAPGDETERSSRPPARSGACRRAGPAPTLSPSARSSARRTCATWPSGPATTACRSCRSSTRRGGSTASCHDHRRRDRGPRRAGDRHVLRAGPGASPGCWTGRRPPGAGLAPARGGSGPGRAAARCLPGRLRRAARSRSRGAGQRGS
jgi:Methyltransferase domain